MEYLLCLLAVLAITIFMQWKYKITLYTTARQRWTTITVLFIVATIWDTFAVARGHWSFGARGSVGIHIGVLPLEEYLFFFIVPYFIIMIYKVCTRGAEAYVQDTPEDMEITQSRQASTMLG